jgi:ribosome modulation factor
VNIQEAYKKGWDCGMNGANTENCNFSIFALPENMKAWEQGKNDAELTKLNEV